MPVNAQEKRDGSALHSYRADQVSAFVWIAVGVVVLTQSLQLDFTQEYGPGPGFLPVWLGVGVIALGLALFVKATFFGIKTELIALPNRTALTQLIIVMAGIFGLALFAEIIGFLICIGLLFFVLLFFVEKKEWLFSLIMAVASPLVLWLIFEVALEMRMPMGILDLF